MKRSKGELILESHLNTYKIPFEAEYRFCERRFRFDFCFPSKMLAVEVEGGIWMKKSRHTSAKGYINDMEKYNLASSMGWKLLRFTTEQVKKGEAINKILEVLKTTQCPTRYAEGSVSKNYIKPRQKPRIE